MPTVELRISALPIHVRTARLVAAALGRRMGLDAAVIDEVKLAVGEACSRAGNVHRAASVTVPITIEFRDDDDLLEVSVRDFGPPGAQLPPSVDADGVASDKAQAAAAKLLQAPTSALRESADLERGADMASLIPRLGLAMIAGLVDDMTVDERSDPSGIVVTMRWPIVACD